MLLFAIITGAMLWSRSAEAIRWDFDDGTTQGWSAKEALIWGGTRELHLFQGVVEDGVWRITVAPSVTKSHYSDPKVELISSIIGYDSGLFDQVRIRFRTVHHRPTVGNVLIEWTNEHNALSSGWDPEDPPSGSRFGIFAQEIVYTTEWQEVVISLAGQDEKIWEGLLKDIQLSFTLDREGSASEVVKWFAIDWIELTGVEELLQGELTPPHVEYFRFDGAGLFAPPVFYPIAPGIGEDALYLDKAGVLTDLDGDGDLDLFARYDYSQEGKWEDEVGWLMAVNDGRGALELGPIEKVAALEQPSIDAATGTTTVSGVVLEVMGADLTGDGQDEIVLSISNSGQVTAVWSIDSELQVEVLVQIADRWIRDVADRDGDDRGELFVGDIAFEGSTLEVWDVEQGVWTFEEVAAAKHHQPAEIGDFSDDGVLDVLWLPIAGRVNTWIVESLDKELQRSEIFEFAEWRQVLGVGDFDDDGQMDFLTEFIRDQVEGSKGFVLQSKSAGGRLEAEVLYDDRLFRRSPVMMHDLNADGVEDWVFVGGDRASGFGVFVEWGGRVNPTHEGERHQLEGSGTYVLCGDMDGDGDLDLVVLDPILGGVHVLKSSLSEQPTAVLMPAAEQPAQHRLGDSYPNPFNPAVVIPLDLATDAAGVSLTIYDVLGRRVRQVWDGALGTGSHRFTWDGRDAAGGAVAAGVYIYEVEVDGRVEAKKTTKLP